MSEIINTWASALANRIARISLELSSLAFGVVILTIDPEEHVEDVLDVLRKDNANITGFGLPSNDRMAVVRHLQDKNVTLCLDVVDTGPGVMESKALRGSHFDLHRELVKHLSKSSPSALTIVSETDYFDSHADFYEVKWLVSSFPSLLSHFLLHA